MIKIIKQIIRISHCISSLPKFKVHTVKQKNSQQGAPYHLVGALKLLMSKGSLGKAPRI